MDGIGSGVPLLSYPQIQNVLRIEFARARRYSYPLSCLVLQIDGLDRLRDLHGSGARDDILNRSVRLLQAQMRGSDSIGLYHDRVAIILPHTDLAGARAVAERIREALRQNPQKIEGKELRLTASIGLAAFAERGTIFYDSILKNAEAALAQAIASGGNRVESSAPGQGPSSG